MRLARPSWPAKQPAHSTGRSQNTSLVCQRGREAVLSRELVPESWLWGSGLAEIFCCRAVACAAARVAPRSCPNPAPLRPRLIVDRQDKLRADDMTVATAQHWLRDETWPWRAAGATSARRHDVETGRFTLDDSCVGYFRDFGPVRAPLGTE
jgi:hypothetical protein